MTWGERGVFADMLKDCDGGLVMRNGDDNRFAFVQASVCENIVLRGVADLAFKTELLRLSHTLAIQVDHNSPTKMEILRARILAVSP